MNFYSNITNFYQANPHVGQKLTNYLAVMAIIPCMYDSRLLLYNSKVYNNSYVRFMKAGMGIIHNFILQPHHFLPSKSPFWRKIEQLWGGFCPKDMYVWLYTDFVLVRSQY